TQQLNAVHRTLPSFPTRRSSDLISVTDFFDQRIRVGHYGLLFSVTVSGRSKESTHHGGIQIRRYVGGQITHHHSAVRVFLLSVRSEEHTSELQSRENLVCRLLLE